MEQLKQELKALKERLQAGEKQIEAPTSNKYFIGIDNGVTQPSF